MMSQLQIEAYRHNARLSTGPTTAEDRTASRMNALKHGLTAQQIVLFDEAAEDFEAFFCEIVVALDPRDPAETQLAERIAVCAWRLRRSYRIEAAMFENVQRSWTNDAPTFTSQIEHLFIRVTAYDDHLATLSRCEVSLERSIQRALFALEHRQIRRLNRP